MATCPSADLGIEPGRLRMRQLEKSVEQALLVHQAPSGDHSGSAFPERGRKAAGDLQVPAKKG